MSCSPSPRCAVAGGRAGQGAEGCLEKFGVVDLRDPGLAQAERGNAAGGAVFEHFEQLVAARRGQALAVVQAAAQRGRAALRIEPGWCVAIQRPTSPPMSARPSPMGININRQTTPSVPSANAAPAISKLVMVTTSNIPRRLAG